MTFNELDIPGVVLIEDFQFEDNRGLFVKPFSWLFDNYKSLNFQINEIYYSISKKNVIRGMHFQKPPMAHTKLIYITSGQITDVLLDMRKSSSKFKTFIELSLKANENALLVPPGIAHGFLSIEDGTTVVYNQSSPYSIDHDDGILWNSFGYNWDVDKPIISKRDQLLNPLMDYITPFN